MCQSHPSSFATSLTLRAHRPTCSVIHRPARSVMASRDAAIRSSSSVQLPFVQSGSGHRHRRLCQISLVHLPKHGRSTSVTIRWSFRWARTPHSGHPGRTCSTLDMDLEHRTTVVDAEHVDLREPDEDLADACRVLFDGRTEESRASHAVRLAAASPRKGDVVPRHFRSSGLLLSRQQQFPLLEGRFHGRGPVSSNGGVKSAGLSQAVEC